MEAGAQLAHLFGVVGRAGGTLHLHVGAQGGHIFLRELLRQGLRGMPLDRPAQVEGVARLFGRGLGDRGDLAGRQIDQPFARQRLQRLPHDRAAHAVELAESDLAQLNAGQKAVGRDGVADAQNDFFGFA